MAVLTLGLAVLRSGLAERVARFFLQRCAGRPRALYLQLLLSFPLLTLLLPSATTRTGILIHVYDQASGTESTHRAAPRWRRPSCWPQSVNRLASTVLFERRSVGCRYAEGSQHYLPSRTAAVRKRDGGGLHTATLLDPKAATRSTRGGERSTSSPLIVSAFLHAYRRPRRHAARIPEVKGTAMKMPRWMMRSVRLMSSQNFVLP